MTSYSPCFRKEVGAHGIEERGVYRIHQFEKQEMVIICHHGIRSMQVARYFDQIGFTNIINLQGGVDAWAKQVDISMALY